MVNRVALENADHTDAENRSVPNPYTIRPLIPFFDMARQRVAVAFMLMVVDRLVIVRFRRTALASSAKEVSPR